MIAPLCEVDLVSNLSMVNNEYINFSNICIFYLLYMIGNYFEFRACARTPPPSSASSRPSGCSGTTESAWKSKGLLKIKNFRAAIIHLWIIAASWWIPFRIKKCFLKENQNSILIMYEYWKKFFKFNQTSRMFVSYFTWYNG